MPGLDHSRPSDVVGNRQIMLSPIGFDVTAGEEPFAFARLAEFTGGYGTDADAIFDVESCQFFWARLIRYWKVLAL